MFEIHNDPLPTPRGNRGMARYPLADLAVGQCFYVTLEQFGGTKRSLCSSLSASCGRYEKKTGAKFTTRFIAEKNAIGVWRIA